jgi:dTDP-4-dehydrorhamnose reductase
VYATVRREFDFSKALGQWAPDGVICGVAVENPRSVESAIGAVRPDAVLNCIAIRRARTPQEFDACFAVNTLFPSHLAAVCQKARARLIHISSDCVFSGSRGHYAEDDPCDTNDAYGWTKAAGEVYAPNCLTLRTSIVGREIREPKTSVVEWLLSQQGGTIKGYCRAFFSGVTTCALSEIVRRLLLEHRELSGLFHVAGNPISKLALLEAVRDRFALRIAIEPDSAVAYDRSLDGTALERRTGLRPPSWPEMIDELYTDFHCNQPVRHAQNC